MPATPVLCVNVPPVAGAGAGAAKVYKARASDQANRSAGEGRRSPLACEMGLMGLHVHLQVLWGPPHAPAVVAAPSGLYAFDTRADAQRSSGAVLGSRLRLAGMSPDGRGAGCAATSCPRWRRCSCDARSGRFSLAEAGKRVRPLAGGSTTSYGISLAAAFLRSVRSRHFLLYIRRPHACTHHKSRGRTLTLRRSDLLYGVPSGRAWFATDQSATLACCSCKCQMTLGGSTHSVWCSDGSHAAP